MDKDKKTLHIKSRDATSCTEWTAMITENWSTINSEVPRAEYKLKGSVKEPNILIYFFFRPSLNPVLFPMFCLMVEEVSDFSVLKYY